MNFSQKQTHSLLSKMGYNGPEDPKMMEAFMASNPRAAATMGKFDRVMKKKSGMAVGGYVPAGFDPQAYLKANPDVANSPFASNPFEHYQLHGRNEGRSIAPTPTGFDPQAYLKANPDVAGSQYKDNPLEHFQLYGRTEGRQIAQPQQKSTRPNLPWLNPPKTQQAPAPTQTSGQSSGNAPAGFNAQEYLRLNPDVANSPFKDNPLEHYLLHGRSEGRPVGQAPAGFNPQAYLQANPDVANSEFKDNPLEHYLLHGKSEGRPVAPTQQQPQLTPEQMFMMQMYGMMPGMMGQQGQMPQGMGFFPGGVQYPQSLSYLGPQGGPQGLVARQTPAQMQPTDGTTIDPTTGQVGPVDTVSPTTIGQADTAETPEAIDSVGMTAEEVTAKIQEALEGLQAEQAQPTAGATVQGQLESLMADFENGATPPWASGAIRNAMGAMQSRGLGASSMAGQAIIQAAMESALPIAAADAQTTAQFEMQNLNNRQQTAIFNTQQRISGMLSDQAAVNAAAQFNAASENQTNQFYSNLQSTVARFNADQVNAVRQFNAKEKNAAKMFNSQLKAQRDQFNAQNSLVIAQANAKWRQDIQTINTAATNESNMEFVKQTNRLTEAGLNNLWQKERDMMDFAFNASENAQERNLSVLLADKNLEEVRNKIDAENDRMFGAGLASLASSVLDWGFG